MAIAAIHTIITSRRLRSGATRYGKPMNPPDKSRTARSGAYDRPTPKVSRLKKAKVLTDAERAAFLASRPDLASKS
jgi:hypothetical protein